MDDSQLQRYSRHILLDSFGIEGQQKLGRACALIVGAGGLGCPAALYLAAAGVGKIIIADDDAVELTNLQRQILHTANRIGNNKANSAKKTLTRINPHCQITALPIKLTKDNAANAIANADVVLDCTDNYAARHLINRTSKNAKTPLVFAAAAGWDGQLAVFDFRQDDSPCYHCLFDENDAAPETPCALFGVFSPLVGTMGCLQAGEAIKLIAMPHLAKTGKLLVADGRVTAFREIALRQDPACPVCASQQQQSSAKARAK